MRKGKCETETVRRERSGEITSSIAEVTVGSTGAILVWCLRSRKFPHRYASSIAIKAIEVAGDSASGRKAHRQSIPGGGRFVLDGRSEAAKQVNSQPANAVPVQSLIDGARFEGERVE